MNATMRLERLTYVSEAAEKIGDADIQVLVGVSRMLNRRRDVTGLLVFTGSHFLQVLEGRSDALDALLTSLRQDRRHHRLRILNREPALRREYDGWAMVTLPGIDLSASIETLHSAPTPLDALLDSVEQKLSSRFQDSDQDLATGFWPV